MNPEKSSNNSCESFKGKESNGSAPIKGSKKRLEAAAVASELHQKSPNSFTEGELLGSD
jgi:hypothetical protein